MSRLTIIVPLLPPSVNHYKEPKIVRRGRFSSLIWIETPEAQLFKLRVRSVSHGATLIPVDEKERRRTRYRLRVAIYLGKGQRGDGDNFWKVIADALTQAQVIHTDDAVDAWILYKFAERDGTGRTVITVRSYLR